MWTLIASDPLFRQFSIKYYEELKDINACYHKDYVKMCLNAVKVLSSLEYKTILKLQTTWGFGPKIN